MKSRDSCERNVVGGKNVTAKRRYGLDQVISQLDDTSKTEAGFTILMMNGRKKVYGEFLRPFFALPVLRRRCDVSILYFLVFSIPYINCSSSTAKITSKSWAVWYTHYVS